MLLLYRCLHRLWFKNYQPESKQASIFTTTSVYSLLTCLVQYYITNICKVFVDMFRLVLHLSKHQCSQLLSRVYAGIDVQHYKPETKQASMFTTTIQNLSRRQCSTLPSRVEAGINVHNYHPESKQASMFTTTIQSLSRHQCSQLPSRD